VDRAGGTLENTTVAEIEFQRHQPRKHRKVEGAMSMRVSLFLALSVILASVAAIRSRAVTTNVLPQDGSASVSNSHKHTLEATITTRSNELGADKASFKVGERIVVLLSLTNNSTESVYVLLGGEYSHHRLRLLKDGKVVQIRKDVSKTLLAKDKEDSLVGIHGATNIDTGQTVRVASLNLNRWYDELEPGQYQLTVTRHFKLEGKGRPPVESNAVTFEVVP
jgi:hypothetical protein